MLKLKYLFNNQDLAEILLKNITLPRSRKQKIILD